MSIHADKTQEYKSRSVASSASQKESSGESTFQFVDNRPEAIAQRKLQEMANDYSARQQQPIQKKENNTGLPDNLKTGIENLSGMSLDDVKVHYNSDKPAQLQAHAYAQGTDIHLASGQEKHLPHEAWHVVQQKQGRVSPTIQLKGKVNINDDAGLEKEADVMGAKALQAYSANHFHSPDQGPSEDKETVQAKSGTPIQLMPKPEEIAFLTEEELKTILAGASMTEIYVLYTGLCALHPSPETRPPQFIVIRNYLNAEYKKVLATINHLAREVGYTPSRRPFMHELFENLTLTLYPVEGKGPKAAKMSHTVHRPILDIEFVGREAFARCYIGLYGQAGDSGFKDITSDDEGNITLKDIGLMNVGNPMKALLWCEDYLKNKEHYTNGASKPAPKPVVRSFLVPLSDVENLFLRNNGFESTRPLDQDRGAGQFGNIRNGNVYSEVLNPLIGSLVSFFHDPDDFRAASDKGQAKYGLIDLQNYLTGNREDPRAMTTSGIAAQHKRADHEAEFGDKYLDVMTAYYESVDTQVTGFTPGTKGDPATVRSSHIPAQFDAFPLVKKEALKLLPPEEEKQTESITRLRAFIEAYAALNPRVDEEDAVPEVEDDSGSGKEADSDPKSATEPKQKAEKADPRNQTKHAGEQDVVIPSKWFRLRNNVGGGDCLYHALEGRNLNGDKILELRNKIAQVRAGEPDTEEGQNYNANVAAATITQTPALANFAPLVIGRDQVPNAVLASLQAIPGVYAGPEELIQWCAYRNKSVIVVDRDGSVIRYRAAGSQPMFNIRTHPAQRQNLRALVASNNYLVLYKSAFHWELIEGVTANFPNE